MTRGRTRVGPALLLAIGVACGGAAGPAMAASLDTTLLHLSATGTVQEAPDLLVAQLVANSDAASPAAAQRQVNTRMAAATRLAAGTGTVRWQLGGYGVDRGGDKQQIWTARQTLRLEGPDAGILLDLVGRLQAAGLAVDTLSWILSPQHLAAARARASDQALKALRARADAAAASLGLKVGLIRDVTLGGGSGPIRPVLRMMASAAPQATPDAQEVVEEASAEIELHP